MRVIVDSVDGRDWDHQLAGFSDATVYQSAAYGSARWGSRALSRLMVTQEGSILAMAQARIVKVPLVPVGLAYVGWGPAWCRRGSPPEIEIFRTVIRALRDEYARRRGLFLRIVPNLFTDAQRPMQVLQEEGFDSAPQSTRTIILDLTVPTEELRAGFRRRWRQTLAKAERDDRIDWVEGTGLDLYEEALKVYGDMRQRKRFAEFVDMQQFRAMQADLPPDLRTRVMIGRMAGAPIAAMAWSVVGDTGLPLLSATGRQALENDAAYAMWWRMLTRMKAEGLRACDLGGINPERNPGGYTFKSGMAKKHGREVQFLGEFGLGTNALSRTAFSLARRGKQALVSWKLQAERRRRAKLHPAATALPAAGPADSDA